MFKVDAALMAGGLGVDAEGAQAWVELAAERVADGSVPICLIPGAADDPAIDIELTAVRRNPVNVDGMAYPLPGGLALISDSCRLGSPPVAERLVALRADDRPLVLMTAAPPYDPATASGSREVAKAIDRLRPALSVHGCSGVGAETPDPKRFIGDTLALTPGSEAIATACSVSSSTSSAAGFGWRGRSRRKRAIAGDRRGDAGTRAEPPPKRT